MLLLLYPCIDCEIPLVQHVGFGCLATSLKCHGWWPFCATFIPLPLWPLSSHLQCSLDPKLVDWLPISGYWLNQTASLWLDCNGSCLWFWLPPANIVYNKEIPGRYFNTVWYDTRYLSCHMTEIGILWVCFLLLLPSVVDIQYLQYTANLNWVGVGIINIQIILPPALWEIRCWIKILPSSCD